jgi:hypothetical protein
MIAVIRPFAQEIEITLYSEIAHIKRPLEESWTEVIELHDVEYIVEYDYKPREEFSRQSEWLDAILKVYREEENQLINTYLES